MKMRCEMPATAPVHVRPSINKALIQVTMISLLICRLAKIAPYETRSETALAVITKAGPSVDDQLLLALVP
jgi:hypothetical protein